MDYTKLSTDEIIKELKKESIYFQSLPRNLRDNRSLVLKAIDCNKCVLKFVSERLRDDEDVVLAVLKKEGYELRNVSERLKDNKIVVLEAVKNDCWALYWASERLKNDIDVVLEAIKKTSITLMYASEILQNNAALLTQLEKADVKSMTLNQNEKKWYVERMEVLANIREKELVENSITPSNKKASKLKF